MGTYAVAQSRCALTEAKRLETLDEVVFPQQHRKEQEI
jgi:hypothetical protein